MKNFLRYRSDFAVPFIVFGTKDGSVLNLLFLLWMDGTGLPMLYCMELDFAYMPRWVLFQNLSISLLSIKNWERLVFDVIFFV
jgi:hypothetical protein